MQARLGLPLLETDIQESASFRSRRTTLVHRFKKNKTGAVQVCAPLKSQKFEQGR